MHRPSAGSLAGQVARRVVNPRHLWRAVRLHRGRKRRERAHGDAQLLLYSRILPGGFLHYGYFDDPDTNPREISLNDINRAQRAYAENLLQHAVDSAAPVLDVGCGMGGLLGLLQQRGFAPVALSPDRNQIRHVQQHHRDVPCINSKFEDLDVEEHRGRYGTVIMSESAQYLELDRALPLVKRIRRPGGRWIVCDYFRRARTEGSGHVLEEFLSRVSGQGWRILVRRDITDNVLPSLAYVHMWGSEVVRPGIDYFCERLERKEPGLHYLCENTLDSVNRMVDDALLNVDPQHFARHKCYMLLVME